MSRKQPVLLSTGVLKKAPTVLRAIRAQVADFREPCPKNRTYGAFVRSFRWLSGRWGSGRWGSVRRNDVPIGSASSAPLNCAESETHPKRVWITSRDASWLLLGSSFPIG